MKRAPLLLALCLTAISTVATAQDADIERLRKVFQGRNADQWLTAAVEAKSLAPASKALLPELCELTVHSSRPMRQAAFEAIEANDKPLYEAMLMLVAEHPALNPKSRSATRGTASLKSLGAKARPAVGALIKLDEFELAYEIAPDHEELIKHVFRLASGRPTRQRGLALLVKVELNDTNTPHAVGCMIAGVKEGHILLVHKRLGELGAAAEKAIPALRDIKTAKPAQRQAAAETLGQIEAAILKKNEEINKKNE